MKQGFIRWFLLWMVVCLSACVSSAAGVNELLKFIPDGTEYVIAVDLDRLDKTSGYVESFRENSPFNDQLEEFERKYHLKLEDCATLLWVGGGKYVRGTLLEVVPTEPELLRKLTAGGTGFTTGKVDGRTVHYLKPEFAAIQPRMRLVLCYLTETVVLATEEEYLAGFLGGLKSPESSRLNQIDRPADEPAAWGFFNLQAMQPKKKKNNPLLGMFGNMRRALVELRFDGTDGKDVVLNANAVCKDANSATLLGMMLPSYLGMGAAFLFAQDAQLGQDLLKTLQVDLAGARVGAALNIDAPLAARIGRYLEREIRARILPPDPVPSDLQNR